MKNTLQRGRGWLDRLVRTAGNIFIGTCSREGCSNRPSVFGVCEEHFSADMQAAQDRIDREEHRKLTDAMAAALRTTESERGSSPNEKVSCGGEEKL